MNLFELGGLFLYGSLFLVFFAIIAFIVGAILYLVQAFGLYGMGKKAGLENTWLAFVPIANFYLMGKLIKEIKVDKYVVPSAELVLPVACVVVLVLGNIPVLGKLISLCAFLLYLAGYYNLYSLYRPKDAVMFTVLSVLIVTVPFFIFMMRNDEMVVPEQKKNDSVPVQ